MSMPTKSIPARPFRIASAWAVERPPATGVPVPGAKRVQAIDVEGQIGLYVPANDAMGFRCNGLGAKAVASEAHRIVGRNKAYLTFDIDCLDPSFAPGTGTPVAGGLSSAQALAILKGLAGIDFVGMDIVEVAPPYDSADITALAAAHIAHEWLALYAVRPGGPAA